MNPTISIIIPVLNEAETLPALLAYLFAITPPTSLEEIIVVDGGSQDGTKEALSQFPAVRLLSSPKGRAKQMNAGAKVARGDRLYFLHADTYPPEGFDQHILDAVSQPVAGCFRLQFQQADHILLRIAPWFTQFSSPLFRGGDQSLFITKAAFEALGGFDESYEVYEDVEFIQRIRKRYCFHILPAYVRTSARRFSQNGTLRLYVFFLMIHLKYFCGAGPEKLAAYYHRHIQG